MTGSQLFLSTPEEAKTHRKKLQMTQGTFWAKVGVVQSGGSRYESGKRDIPYTLQLLLHLAYAPAERVQLALEELRS